MIRCARGEISPVAVFRAAHGRGASRQVDVAPAQGQCVADAQAGVELEHDQRDQAAPARVEGARDLDQALDFLGAQVALGVGALGRFLNAARRRDEMAGGSGGCGARRHTRCPVS